MSVDFSSVKIVHRFGVVMMNGVAEYRWATKIRTVKLTR